MSPLRAHTRGETNQKFSEIHGHPKTPSVADRHTLKCAENQGEARLIRIAGRPSGAERLAEIRTVRNCNKLQWGRFR
jgi:endonuclease YncB( thermonuclease family)